MQTQELPLFSSESTPPLNKQYQAPMLQKISSFTPRQHAALSNALSSMFPTQVEENKVT